MDTEILDRERPGPARLAAVGWRSGGVVPEPDGTDPAGDSRRPAVAAFYQAHALGLVRLAHIMLGDAGEAEDVVQDAFCGLYQRWALLSDPSRALQYVRSAVLNRCRSALRHRTRHGRPGNWSAAAQIPAASLAPPPAPPRRGLGTTIRAAGRVRRARPPVWFRPATAAAAVLAIIAGSFVIPRAVREPQQASQSASAVVPPYYAALAGYLPSEGVAKAGDVAVRASATGRVLAMVTPPAHEAVTGLAAAADDRTFVLAAEMTAEIAHRVRDHPVQTGLAVLAPSTRFFLLRFDPRRDVTMLTPLALPALPGVSWFDLSPDAGRLAVAQSSRDTLSVRVFSLATGASRTWSVGSGYQAHQHRWPETIAASWISDQTIAFGVAPVRLRSSYEPMGLLNTAAPGGSLISASVMYLRSAARCSHALVTAGGRRAVDVLQVGGWWARVDCSLSRGQIIATTPSRRAWYAGRNSEVEDLLWASPTGHTLIVSGYSGRLDSNVVGVLDGTRFTVLPGSAPIPFMSPFVGAAVAW